MLIKVIIISIFLLLNAHGKEILLATGINHDPPYVYGNETLSSHAPGVTIEILQQVEKMLNIKFRIVKHPWKRVVNEIKVNTLDGGFHFSFLEQRKSFVEYPIPKGKELPDPRYSISTRSYFLYKLKNVNNNLSGNKLDQVAAIAGGSVIPILKAKGHDVIELNTDKQMIKMLLRKRIYSFAGLDNMMDPKLSDLPAGQSDLIEKVHPPLASKPYFISFSKNFYRMNQDTVWKIWKAIDQLKKSGFVDKLFLKYSHKT